MAGDVLVLGYHALSPRWEAALSIPPERLERQLQLLTQRGYESVTFTEAATAARSLTGGRRRRKLVAVTFDDGFKSVVEHGLGILSRAGFVATVFVPTDFIGKASLDWPRLNRWLGQEQERELTPMSSGDLSQLQRAGWEIASHTCSHPRLTDLDDRRLGEELRRSREVCSQLTGTPCTSIAYPYGAVDGRVAAATRQAGYLAGAALPSRIHRAHQYRWPRIGIWHRDEDWVFGAKLSPVRRRHLDLTTGSLSPLPRWRFVDD